MGAPAVSASHLTKTYGRRGARGVVDLTFDVARGEVFGFLGPNGAGKTTTIRCMLDLLRPTSGEVRVLGLDPRADAPALAARVGYLPGEPGFAERLTAREVLRYSANLRGGGEEADARIDALAKRLDLDLARRVREMSSGNKRKVGIVQAFMHDPDLLVLDEPTNGLDPLVQQEFHKLVREAKRAGRTVFLSSHVLSEVESLCDRVAIVREGRLVVVEDVDGLKARAVRHGRARFATPPPAGALVGVDGVSHVRALEKGSLVFSVRGPTGPLVRALAALDATDLSLKEPTLEDAFLEYYSAAEAPAS